MALFSPSRRFLLAACGIGLISLGAAALCSIPWTTPDRDPRWEMIRERTQAAKRRLAARPQPSREMLRAEIELDAAIASGDLPRAGAALHQLERLTRED